MINMVSTYRRFIASLLAIWMGVIIVSGIVFIHKEVTSSGEIVTHVHPYDLFSKTKKHHHKSDAEIHYLDVVFHGSFVDAEFFVYEAPVRVEYNIGYCTTYTESQHYDFTHHYYLRGPPFLV